MEQPGLSARLERARGSPAPVPWARAPEAAADSLGTGRSRPPGAGPAPVRVPRATGRDQAPRHHRTERRRVARRARRGVPPARLLGRLALALSAARFAGPAGWMAGLSPPRF